MMLEGTKKGEKAVVTLLDPVQTADAGADRDADPFAVLVGHLESGVRDRLLGGGDAIVDERIGLAGFLARHVEGEVEVPDRRPDPARETADVEGVDGGDAAPAGNDIFPRLLDGGPDGSDQPETGNDDSAHQELPRAGNEKRPQASGAMRGLPGVSGVPVRRRMDYSVWVLM